MAENTYSHHRLEALAAEWSADYPTLALAAHLLFGMRSSFMVRDLLVSDFEGRLSKYLEKVEKGDTRGRLYDLAYACYGHEAESLEKVYEIYWIFSKVGIGWHSIRE